MTRAEFIAIVGPIAVQVRLEGGPLFPSIAVAQMLLETGGKIPAWNNVVGYKVGSGTQTPYWHGRSVNTGTREVINNVSIQTKADWRAYDSVYDCLKDQALLFENSRYARVRAAKTANDQADALYACGYATDAPKEVDGDPDYAEKLQAIVKSYTYLDQEVDDMLEALQQQIKQLQDAQATAANTLEAHVARIGKLEAQIPAPEWAKEAAAYYGPHMSTKEGSYDFWRILVIQYRKDKGLTV